MKQTLHLLKTALTVLLLSGHASLAWAYPFEYNGIWYNITTDTEVWVVHGEDSNSYFGDVVIPPKITLGEQTYIVTGILGAFTGSIGLTSVHLPSTITFIEDGSFANCVNLKSVNIPNGVWRIENNTFSGCSSLTSITLPSSVTTIGNYAFAGCSSMQSINLPASVKYFILYNTRASQAFMGCTGKLYIDCDIPVQFEGANFSEVIIKKHVRNIGQDGFKGCTTMQSVTFEEGLDSISYNAFDGCTALTSVTLPNSLRILENSAFRGCTSLKDVVIGSGIEVVNWDAFNSCSSLRTVTCHATKVPEIRLTSFEGVPLKYATLHVPLAAIEDYKQADVWKEFGTIRPLTFLPTTSITLFPEATIMGAGSKRQLTPTILPEYASFDVAWKSSNDNVATVDAKGNVTAVAVGNATITATTKDGTNLSATCKITVVEHTIYIEMDCTSQFPLDWQEWFGATNFVGGAAPQVTTNDGRTTPACERYNEPCIDSGEVFSRTLSGLVNGIYCIELYAAAAYTPWRGFDSELVDGDETAVYLYAETPEGKVKKYIPARVADNFNETGLSTVVLNDVEVTDGTIKIGMVTEKPYTNWHVVQIKGITAYVDAFEQHDNVLRQAMLALASDDYANVTGNERTALTQAVNKYTTVSTMTATAYQTAITAVQGATSGFVAAKEAYDAWHDIKTDVASYDFPYASESKKAATAAAKKATPVSADDASTKTEALKKAYRICAESSALLEGIDGATDMTNYIQNPKAESWLDPAVWQTVNADDSDGSISIVYGQPWTYGNGDEAQVYFDGGNWGANFWDVTFKQSVTLPVGHYQLSVMGRSECDVAQTLFVDDKTADMPHIGNTGGLFNNGWNQTSLEFELADETTVELGVRGVTTNPYNWMSFSDFRLAKFPDIPTGISILKETDSNSPVFDFTGRRIAEKPTRGLYIRSGKKYLVK